MFAGLFSQTRSKVRKSEPAGPLIRFHVLINAVRRSNHVNCAVVVTVTVVGVMQPAVD